MSVLSWQQLSWSPGELLATWLLGLGYDVAAGIFFLAPLGFLLFLLPTSWLVRKRGRYLVGFLTGFISFLTVFAAISLVLFWQEFHTNFNFIAVDYLIYTTEMIGTIVQSFNMVLVVPCILLGTYFVTSLQLSFLPRQLDKYADKSWGSVLTGLVALVVLPVLVGSLVRDEWRENISSNNYNVEIAGNGAACFMHAFFHNELDYNRFYAVRDEKQVLNDLRSYLQTGNATFHNAEDVTRRVQNHSRLSVDRPNVVIITVESLSASFCGAFGAEQSWTPSLDELTKEAYIYTNMYATGTRTVRGLEALSLAVPPTPGQSILRRPNCNDMNSLGNIMNGAGYQSDFIYGGYGYFDNMNEFFSTNGYTIKDRESIPEEEIFNETIWGVADEILFSQVLKSMDEHYQAGQPALEMIMTTTNHRPFIFPEGRIDDKYQGIREGACRYTDWAISDFLKRAQSQPWFDDTIFVIVADHQANVAGKTSLPVNKYHIPCIIYSPKLVAPGKNDRLISQSDLAPTLLGMLGISYDSRFLGRDIAQVKPGDEHVFISTYQSIGYIQGDELVVLEPGKKVKTYHIDDWQTSRYTPVANKENLTNAAITWYQGASYLFKNGLLKSVQD